MPVSVLARLPQDQLEMILAHELGHIRRFDYLVNLLQVALETLLFYHPAIGWMSRRVREEREHRCDELVVRTCGKPTTYARALTNLEVLRVPPAATAVSATGGNLLARIKFIIDDRSPGRGSTVAQFVLAALAGLTVVLGAQQGYSLSSELNRVAYSAQLQVSDVQWTTWGRSREAWGQGIQDYANSKQREQLADLRIESLSFRQSPQPATDFEAEDEMPAVKQGTVGSMTEELARVEDVKSLLAQPAQPQIMVSASLLQPHKKPITVAQSSQPTALSGIDSVLFTAQPFNPGFQGQLERNLPDEPKLAERVGIKPVKSRMPNYPWSARRKGIEGFVELEFSVNGEGKVTDVAVLKAIPEGIFEKAAQKALSKWTFEVGDIETPRFKQTFEFALKDVEPVPPSGRICGLTGTRTCVNIARGISVVWVNASTEKSNKIALN
jgi:TonB family protein